MPLRRRIHTTVSDNVPALVMREAGQTLFNNMDLRQAPLSPVNGRPQKRAPRSEAERLLDGI